MKSLFNQQAMSEVLNRIDKLTQHSKPEWGEMDVAQMLAHCSGFQNIALGNSNPKRGWLGFLIGRFVKSTFYNNEPLPKNMTTIPSILVSDQRNFETEKENLKQKIIDFYRGGEETCTSHPHPFFGKLVPEEWAKGMYKHVDHHLKQFGV